MVDRGGLENRCARKGTVGSNPTLSANNIGFPPFFEGQKHLSPNWSPNAESMIDDWDKRLLAWLCELPPRQELTVVCVGLRLHVANCRLSGVVPRRGLAGTEKRK